MSAVNNGVDGPEEEALDVLDEPGEEVAVIAAVTIASLVAAFGVYLLVRRYYPVGAVEFQGRRWSFHETDKVWAARMVVGESGTSNMQAGAAVLWAVAQRWVTKPQFQGMSFTSVMRAFSQPINPIWSSPSGSGCQQRPDMCSQTALSNRARIQSTPWSSIPMSVQQLVEEFFSGRVANPIPGYNNFAASWATSGGSSELPAVAIGGNTFMRDPGSLPGEVRVV